MLHVPNGGPGAAREAGRLAARGDFIQYLDSDDLLAPRKFELQVAALASQPDAAIAYGLCVTATKWGTRSAATGSRPTRCSGRDLPSFLIARWWETLAPLYRRSVTDAVGPWTTLRLEEDWEYDCRAGALGVTLAYVDEVVGEHRDHSDGRLSRGAANDPVRLRDRAAGPSSSSPHTPAAPAFLRGTLPELQHFARELFHLGRQCGAAGLAAESKRLVALAQDLSTARDIRVYDLAARVLGWQRAGRAADWIERPR